MRPVADSRGVCYAPWMRQSTLRSMLRGTAGLGIIEVLAVTVIVGIAVIGVALMFGKGSAWVSATGADRVAAGLAQQRIEQIRAFGLQGGHRGSDLGWDVAGTEDSAPNVPPSKEGAAMEGPRGHYRTAHQAGNNHTFFERSE